MNSHGWYTDSSDGGMPEFAAPKLGKFDNTVSMDVEVPANANGVLYSLGGFSGGLSCYVKDGRARHDRDQAVVQGHPGGHRHDPGEQAGDGDRADDHHQGLQRDHPDRLEHADSVCPLPDLECHGVQHAEPGDDDDHDGQHGDKGDHRDEMSAAGVGGDRERAAKGR